MLVLIFKQTSIEVIKRNEVYTFTDFIAVCGDLVGLFLGASIMSIIELIYYTTFRLYWTIKMNRNNFQ